MASRDEQRSELSAAERERLDAFKEATSLSELVELTGANDEEDAYYAAKSEWARLRDAELPPEPETTESLPGDSVVVGDHEFRVHGVTHADTDAERSFLRERVDEYLARGESVYCEQGIRHMYFSDVDDVCEMDDYRWALAECARLGEDSRLPARMGAVADAASVTDRLRDAVFSLAESGSDVYGDRFSRALGDVASDFLTDDEDVATGDDFESFVLSRRAGRDPAALGALQRYYKKTFLPQPLEREWLRRHDRELEVVTHGRNERMADYAVFHNEDARSVHLVVGAAHQPGVRYYLEAHRDGRRDLSDFELVQ